MTIATIEEIASQHNITVEEIALAHRIANNGKVFYQVESRTDATQEPYKVEWNAEYKRLSCTCKAANDGRACWHRRAALAAEALYKQERHIARQREAAAIESTVQHAVEQAEQAVRAAHIRMEWMLTAPVHHSCKHSGGRG